MMWIMAVLIGTLFGCSVYLMLSRSIVDLVFGLALLSHSANLLVFSSGGILRGRPPLIAETAGLVADPLPQALVLTAIVISFGLVAFLMVLVAQLYWKTGTDDGDRLSSEDE